jgi:tetratricopeptide (TPR) repeat protein
MASRTRSAFLLWALFSILLLAPFIPTLLTQQASQEIPRAQQAADSGDWLEAARHMAKAASGLSGRADLWEQAGHYALLGGDATAALDYLTKAGLDRLSPQARIDLGDIYQQSGELSRAIQAWRSALDASSPETQIYPLLFQAYRQQVQFEQPASCPLNSSAAAPAPTAPDREAAILDLHALALQRPQDAQVQYQLGLLLAAWQPEEALFYLRRAAELDASLEHSTGKLVQAIQDASQPGIPAYTLLAAGRALASIEEWELAAQAFTEAAVIQPDYAEAWAYLGEALTHIDADRDGLEEIQCALQLDPASLSAHLFLAYYWVRQERFDLAQQAMLQAQALYPQEAIIQAQSGDILAQSGDLQSAYLAYIQATRLAPQDPLYLRYLIEFSLKYSFDLQNVALPAARQMVILAPGDSQTLDLMAQVLIQLGDLSNAERFVHNALQADPGYAPAHLSLGTIYMLRGDRDLARQELQQVLELAPGSRYAEQALRLLETYLQ